MQIGLDEMERVYADHIQELLSSENILCANSMVALSKKLFEEISIRELPMTEDSESDMLLFQYGTYNWGDAHGEHFSLDITRQIIMPESGEPYQLQFTLVYAPEAFCEVKSYNCWSDDFKSTENFVAHIKTTDGFVLAGQKTPLTYKLVFSQC